MTKVQKLKLTFLHNTVRGKHPKALYRCECGTEKELFIANVNSKSTKSCGCSTNKTHGMSKTDIYNIWIGIKMRCYNENNEDYYNYGGRGVTMCAEWYDNPEAFIKWAIDNGWKSGLEVDKDKNGGLIYSPENCVVITKKNNSNHRRDNHYVEYNNKRQTIQQWSEEINIPASTLWARLVKLKWGIEKSLSTPLKKNKKQDGRR